jgi:hypothetical protein
MASKIETAHAKGVPTLIEEHSSHETSIKQSEEKGLLAFKDTLSTETQAEKSKQEPGFLNQLLSLFSEWLWLPFKTTELTPPSPTDQQGKVEGVSGSGESKPINPTPSLPVPEPIFNYTLKRVIDQKIHINANELEEKLMGPEDFERFMIILMKHMMEYNQKKAQDQREFLNKDQKFLNSLAKKLQEAGLIINKHDNISFYLSWGQAGLGVVTGALAIASLLGVATGGLAAVGFGLAGAAATATKYWSQGTRDKHKAEALTIQHHREIGQEMMKSSTKKMSGTLEEWVRLCEKLMAFLQEKNQTALSMLKK